MTLEHRGLGPTFTTHDNVPQAPRTPEMEALRDALARFNDWPPSGANADRVEARDLADAAQALVDLYDTQLARYDEHMRNASQAAMVDLARRQALAVGHGEAVEPWHGKAGDSERPSD